MVMMQENPSSIDELTYTPTMPVFPSPPDWRDQFIYFLLVDRFDNNKRLQAFDGKMGKSAANHNRIVKISHDGKTIFKRIEGSFSAGTYSSLAASDVPYSLEVSARSENDAVMAVRHKECFVEGIQFDPSSLLTASGSLIIENVIKDVGKK